MSNYSLTVKKVAKKSDYSLFINFFFNSLKNMIIHYFIGPHYSLFIIFLAHYSLFIIKKGHYSLIIIPHPDPRKYTRQKIRLKHTYREIEWVIPVLDNFRHFLYTVESRKFEVIGTRDFILKYREFELAYREKNIKMYFQK